MPLKGFHPAVKAWFQKNFPQPTPAQVQAWPAIAAHEHTLLAAPTGSGKTLAAFLASINDLVCESQEGALPDETRVLYISPLKALSNDVKKNLEEPLQGIRRELYGLGCADAEIRSWVRTGDTPQSERTAMAKKPPHILVTTPESFYLLLTSQSGRNMLRTVRTVIVDEIHAVIGSKRGAHLSLSLERLHRLTKGRLLRIGLSATQRPMEIVAKFLLGGTQAPCTQIDIGHLRRLDLGLEIPQSPLETVMSGEVWEEIYDRLAELVQAHKTTLIFVNTRRMAERLARHVSERVGEEFVTSHHGSLSRERRLSAETRLKSGELKALVATASLELGIDIGAVDLVCQLGSPRWISAFLQRAGRANHSVGGLPKARIFPLSREELLECAALLEAVKNHELDRQIIPEFPLDVMAQQIVAAAACEEWGEDELFAWVTSAYPYRNLPRVQFNAVLTMLSDGYVTRRGRRSAFLHRDMINRKVKARKGSRLTALTNGGAIPDNADYQVILEPAGTLIGTLNEDFAVESLAGDIFQLGNTSWKILRVETGKVRVEDAHGQPPTVPFWLGEAPSRSDELSAALNRLRVQPDPDSLLQSGVPEAAIAQITDYLDASKAALGVMPSQETLVLERFFDESGGMQLVLHSPYGNRINRAWGLSLRKRFCKTFNFELQAAATDNALILSLGPMHSFPLEDVFHYLNSKTVEDVLIQALLDAPMFEVRWRWNANRSLAVPRYYGGKKVAPQLQRMQAADLVALIFPDQAACQENIQGPREIPDHPLVFETLRDCLHEAMDMEGLKNILRRIESGELKLIARDVTEPSPLAQEVLNAKPYAFLDDAPLEERRTQAVYSRRWLDPKTASDLGALDPQAIAKVRDEARPDFSSADELHDVLLWLGLMTPQNMAGGFFSTLVEAGRVTTVTLPSGAAFWIATERLPLVLTVYPEMAIDPPVRVPEEFLKQDWTPESALTELVRGQMEARGPVTAALLAEFFERPEIHMTQALTALETEGAVLRGTFTESTTDTEWCERRLLARIHRYTLNRLRAEIEPVTASDFMRFLFEWQHVTPQTKVEGTLALGLVLAQLEGFSASAAAWEGAILKSRMKKYDPAWLDALCLSGKVIWGRAQAGAVNGKSASPIRTTPIAFGTRKNFALWQDPTSPVLKISADSERIVAALKSNGPMFLEEIIDDTKLLRAQVEGALAELVAKGLLRSDSFSGLRQMLAKARSKRDDAGRWVLIHGKAAPEARLADESAEQIARTLLLRYGVVFRKLMEKENLPAWRDVLMALRRLEARGEIRGGRFIAGFSGEQYALSEAVQHLRDIRKVPLTGLEISLSAADPLNLTGIITPGAKVTAHTKNRVVFKDGVPVAAFEGGKVRHMSADTNVSIWKDSEYSKFPLPI